MPYILSSLIYFFLRGGRYTVDTRSFLSRMLSLAVREPGCSRISYLEPAEILQQAIEQISGTIKLTEIDRVTLL